MLAVAVADRAGDDQFGHRPRARPLRRRPPDRGPLARHRRHWPPGLRDSTAASSRLEGEVAAAMDRSRAAAEPLAAEIDELGGLVKELADAVAAHEHMLESAIANATPRRRARPGACARAHAGRAAGPAERHASRTTRTESDEPARAPARHRAASRARACGDRRADRARDRGQPRRPLSPADRHAAAAQGALLRGADAAAHRRRRRCSRRPTSSPPPRAAG